MEHEYLLADSRAHTLNELRLWLILEVEAESFT